MESLTAALRAAAEAARIDLLGVAPIARFESTDPRRHPAAIFPECRNVVVIGRRIPRGALRGVEEGTQLDSYDKYGRSWLCDRVLALATITVATFLEDAGWEAVPLQGLAPETPPLGVPVRPGLPAPNVIVDVEDAAVLAGLGGRGLCGEVLTPRFGPRQRFQVVLTDAPLDGTPLLAEPVCDDCQACLGACPLGAIAADGTIDEAACRTCRNGARPNLYHPAGRTDRLAALCVRTCVDHLEQAGRVGNQFAQPFRRQPAWAIDRLGVSRLQERADA